MATTPKDEEEKKRLEAEAQARATSSLAATAKNAVQVQSFPQSTPEVRNQVINDQGAKINSLRDTLPDPVKIGPFEAPRQFGPIAPNAPSFTPNGRIMNEQAAKINSLRNTLPTPQSQQMGLFEGGAAVVEQSRANVNNTINTDKAAQYLQDLRFPEEMPLAGDKQRAMAAPIDKSVVPIGPRAFASSDTAGVIEASRQFQQDSLVAKKAQRDAALKKIKETAPARQAAAKAANMTDEAGQKDSIARYNNFRQGIADREQDGRDVQQEMRLSKDQLAMAKANIQNIKRAQARGEVVNPAHIAAAHDYLSRADRRTGGTVNIDEQKRQAGSNVKLYRDDSIAFNKKYGISNEDYSRPKNDMAPVAAPVAAPVTSVKKPEERGRYYTKVSPYDPIIGRV